MESLDLRVLGDVLAWRQAGHHVTLVTVVETWGSAPRPPGALLAVRDDGMLSGSVSGGCVEDDLIARIRGGERVLAGPPAMIAYGVTKAEAARFGIPCGGSLRLVQEAVTDTGWVQEVLQRTSAHELVVRTVNLRTGLVSLSAGQRGRDFAFDGITLRSSFGPKWRLLIIGAGQLSMALAQMACMLDFQVLLCDPREQFIRQAYESGQMGACTHVAGMPDDVVRGIKADAHTAIVALSHDPKLDDLALLEALDGAAFYVGALGSRRNTASRKARLKEHFGLSDSALARLHGPVGLDIAAKTPAEIAVSIIAHIVAVKNQMPTTTPHDPPQPPRARSAALLDV
jgi:xanthine dehydrogenase accessory factor